MGMAGGSRGGRRRECTLSHHLLPRRTRSGALRATCWHARWGTRWSSVFDLRSQQGSSLSSIRLGAARRAPVAEASEGHLASILARARRQCVEEPTGEFWPAPDGRPPSTWRKRSGWTAVRPSAMRRHASSLGRGPVWRAKCNSRFFPFPYLPLFVSRLASRCDFINGLRFHGL